MAPGRGPTHGAAAHAASIPTWQESRDLQVGLLVPPTMGPTLSDSDGEQEYGKTKYDDHEIAFTCRSAPPLPKPIPYGPGVWDTGDEQFLDKVRCHIEIKITEMDPKDGSFSMRLKFNWWLRTLNTHERTRLRLRVPGVRMPRLVTKVEESRIWREESLDSDTTYCWGGVSVMSVTGFEIFEVHDFPFDRQAIHTGLLEFVWRSDKDTDSFDETMKVVSLTTETLSFLPEWMPAKACVHALDERRGQNPSYATRFKLLVRVERQTFYYLIQVFLVSTMITVASILPIVTKRDDHVGDRIGLASGGLLTLIAFKYGVSEQLPAVPYLTYTTAFLLAQIVTLALITLYNVLAYKAERFMTSLIFKDNDSGLQAFETAFDVFEDLLMLGLVGAWTGAFIYTYYYKKPKEWSNVLEEQDVIYGEVPTGPATIVE